MVSMSESKFLFTFKGKVPDLPDRRILQQYLDKLTLDPSKGRFFSYVFLALCIHKTKLGMFSFIIFYLKSKNT